MDLPCRRPYVIRRFSPSIERSPEIPAPANGERTAPLLWAGAGADPLQLVIGSYRQYYKQYLSNDQFQAGEKSQIFNSAAEAHTAGFTTEWDQVTRTPPSAHGDDCAVSEPVRIVG